MFQWLTIALKFMSRLLLPTHLLQALTAVARHQHVARAAQVLHITPGAVSKQLLEAERLLGVPLFDRSHKRLELTPVGHRYVQQVTRVLDELERAALELQAGRSDPGEGQRSLLHLSMLPTIGERWVIPRLPDFLARHPHIDLRFVRFVDGYDFAKPELDCAIRFGDGSWPGALSDYLMGREMVMIACPTLAPTLQAPADVQGHTLLHHVNSPLTWQDWARERGLDGPSWLEGPQMDQVSAQIRAVAAGLGLALVSRCLVQDELNRALVVALPFGQHDQKGGYHFCYPEAKATMPALQAFRHWLRGEAMI
jgi:LysR family transcriptional regulator, glycine cleavage system transcriptional activator